MSATVPEVLKDPTVVAAFITGVVAFVAAGVAFAAGRMQGRGAHWGPVDAVRRQHQREAYAAFLAALTDYLGATNWDMAVTRAVHDRIAAGLTHDDGAARVTAFTQLMSVPLHPIYRSSSVVYLEGPDVIAEVAMTALQSANDVYQAAVGGVMNPADSETVNAYREAQWRLSEAIAFFAGMARTQLNKRW
ncbi:hypothetical protein QJ054_33660 [Streptomyces sp. AN-3]|uniref:hypothetical protein n=1 Tax=Streptomyces sp. AN-3 TaxID=3044177 RepID=UPI00249C290C|nr:hypothetical protein [Streptomyces sp. AN-3]MDI3101984.1 hypothetical protein [Streptomyces sp. AN-3]MDV6291378.1 hypothetical protein [Streptomyces sp. UP1A-1]